MKINGQEINGPAEEVLVLPRSNGDVVIKARAVLDMKDFDAMVPSPQAPGILRAGETKSTPNLADPGYMSQMADYSTKRFAFIAIKSLEATEIEWDTVDYDKPETWVNWEKDLKEAGFNNIEVDRITVCIMDANCLNEAKLQKARESFLAGLRGQ